MTRKYLFVDRFGHITDVDEVEPDPLTEEYPPVPEGWLQAPWNGSEAAIGDWVRNGNFVPSAFISFEDVVRGDRNAELGATDWTQTGDQVPARAVLWAPYRQLLRDVPQQDGFPESGTVDWPERPE